MSRTSRAAGCSVIAGNVRQKGNVYRGFEDIFRGAEAFIAERQARYVPLLEGHGPVLDVGCGRGELLQRLSGASILARGIDSDLGMVERCRAKGLDATQAEAIAYLHDVEPGSLGAIVALQVIEHLPYETLLEFLRLSHSRLRQGGRFIVETGQSARTGGVQDVLDRPVTPRPYLPRGGASALLVARVQRGASGVSAGNGRAGRRSVRVWRICGGGDALVFLAVRIHLIGSLSWRHRRRTRRA